MVRMEHLRSVTNGRHVSANLQRELQEDSCSWARTLAKWHVVPPDRRFKPDLDLLEVNMCGVNHEFARHLGDDRRDNQDGGALVVEPTPTKSPNRPAGWIGPTFAEIKDWDLASRASGDRDLQELLIRGPLASWRTSLSSKARSSKLGLRRSRASARQKSVHGEGSRLDVRLQGHRCGARLGLGGVQCVAMPRSQRRSATCQ